MAIEVEVKHLVKVAVCMAVFDKDDKLLVTRRARRLKHFPGCWVLPGGHLELNEDLEICGLRELSEETGIEITYSEDLKFFFYQGEPID